jgi:hypothetical protein
MTEGIDTGSVRATSPRVTASARRSDVNAFVTEASSNTVSPSTGVRSSDDRLPCAMTRRPVGSTRPTTIPILWWYVSTRSASSLRISSSETAPDNSCAAPWGIATNTANARAPADMDRRKSGDRDVPDKRDHAASIIARATTSSTSPRCMNRSTFSEELLATCS